jgi:hypothetical protein
MSKSFSVIRDSRKNISYLLNIDGVTIKLVEPHDSISGTYGAIALTVYDDAFSTLKNHLWLLDLRASDDIVYILDRVHGFIAKDPTALQIMLYS